MEVAERIGAPYRSSTRAIDKSKWALFERWCRKSSKQGSIFLKAPTFTGYFLAFTGIIQTSTKWNLSIVLNELTKAPFEPQTSNILLSNCFLASFVIWQVPQRNSCLGCKQSILFRPLGKGTSKRRFSKCVSSDYPCFDYHRG